MLSSVYNINKNIAFGAHIVMNDYLLSGINKAKDEAKNGNLDLAYKFYSALNVIKTEKSFDTFEIRPIDGIITRNNDAKPQEILINGSAEYKVRKHENAKSDDGSQCIAGILEFDKLNNSNADKDLPYAYRNYIETREAANKAEATAIETVGRALDMLI